MSNKIKYSEQFVAFVDVIRGGEFTVLDTETTGLGEAEIIQICVMASDGTHLVNTLLEAKRGVSPGATAIHGITNKMLSGQPRWPQIRESVWLALRSAPYAIIYNAMFDLNMLQATDRVWGKYDHLYSDDSEVLCAMHAYAEFRHQWNARRNSWMWHTLLSATMQSKLLPLATHTAAGDCRMTLDLSYHIANSVKL